jgi:NAD(P)-dependent dehydrogenase (short-subunit alcohol dehydrogenase family)
MKGQQTSRVSSQACDIHLGVFGAGKVAVVTGVGPDVGRSIALGFAGHAVDVVLAARQHDRIDSVAAEIRDLGREALAVPTDITEAAGCDRLIRAAVERFGGVDFLVQNAHHEGDWKPVADADVDSWRSIFDVNLYGALYLVKAAVPAMRERGGGAIVLVNSGSLVSTPPALGAYTASKAALAGMARTLAVEVGQWGIRVNGVLLGGVAGENILHAAQWQAAATGITPGEWLENRKRSLPLRFMPSPDQCAGAVLFFCSDLAAAVTGQHLSVNSGQWTT